MRKEEEAEMISTPARILTTNLKDILAREWQVLHEVCKEVDPASPETLKLVEKLFTTLEKGKFVGVGLAAPQIGVLARVFVVNIPVSRMDGESSSKEALRTAVINPVFSDESDEMSTDWEACLSIPGVRGMVPRHSELKVTFINEKGEKQVLLATDFVARVFQHEYDHLDGKLYIERMNSEDKLEPFTLKTRD